MVTKIGVAPKDLGKLPFPQPDVGLPLEGPCKRLSGWFWDLVLGFDDWRLWN